VATRTDARRFVEFDGLHIPVERLPLESGAAAVVGERGECAQHRRPQPAPARVLRDVEVLQIQAAALPCRVSLEENRKADGVIRGVGGDNEEALEAAGVEVTAHLLSVDPHRVRALLEDCELDHEPDDRRAVGARGEAAQGWRAPPPGDPCWALV